jgi:hypothetical protein
LKDDEWEIRLDAAKSLGSIGDARAVEPLCEALKDGNWEVRNAAAEALGHIGDARAVEPLSAAVKDLSMAALSAAESLGLIGSERALEVLVASTKSENKYLRSRALEVLGKRAGKQFGDADRWQQWLDEQKRGTLEPKEAETITAVKGIKYVETKHKSGRTYEVYSAENKEQAWEFIRTKSVNKPLYYIEVNVGDVHNPEIIVGLDIQGTYET